MFGKKKTADLDLKLQSVQTNMENNYHDAAQMSYNEAVALFKAKVEQGLLSKKQISKYQAELEGYERGIKAKGINHQTHAGW